MRLLLKPPSMKKIKFIKSPTGLFKLAYSVGQIGLVKPDKADKCIEHGYAVAVIDSNAIHNRPIKKKRPATKPISKAKK